MRHMSANELGSMSQCNSLLSLRNASSCRIPAMLTPMVKVLLSSAITTLDSYNHPPVGPLLSCEVDFSEKWKWERPIPFTVTWSERHVHIGVKTVMTLYLLWKCATMYTCGRICQRGWALARMIGYLRTVHVLSTSLPKMLMLLQDRTVVKATTILGVCELFLSSCL